MRVGCPCARRRVGKRLDSGIRVIDSFVPLCRGQRLGLDLDAGGCRIGVAVGDAAADGQCQCQRQPAFGNLVVVHVFDKS